MKRDIIVRSLGTFLLAALVLSGCGADHTSGAAGTKEAFSLPNPNIEEQVLYSADGVTVKLVDITDGDLVSRVTVMNTGEVKDEVRGTGKFFNFEIENKTAGFVAVQPSYFSVNCTKIKELIPNGNFGSNNWTIEPNTTQNLSIAVNNWELQLNRLDAIREFHVQFSIGGTNGMPNGKRTELFCVETDAYDGGVYAPAEGAELYAGEDGVRILAEGSLREVSEEYRTGSADMLSVWAENTADGPRNVRLSDWTVNGMEIYDDQSEDLFPGERVLLPMCVHSYQKERCGISQINTLYFRGAVSNAGNQELADFSVSFLTDGNDLTPVVNIPAEEPVLLIDQLVTASLDESGTYSDGFSLTKYSYRLPEIHFDTGDAAAANEEIARIYGGIIRDEKQTMEQKCSIIWPTVDYETFLPGKILSVLVCAENDYGETRYSAYNFDVLTGEAATLEDMLRFYYDTTGRSWLREGAYAAPDAASQLMREGYVEKAKETAAAKFVAVYGESSGYSEEWLAEYQRCLNDTLNKNDFETVYFDGGGFLHVIVDLYSMAGAESYSYDIEIF